MANNRQLSSLLRRLMILAGVSAFIYALNRLLIIPMLPEIGFFNKYLGDMLALPVYLPLSFYLAWRLHLIPEDFQLQLTHIIGAGIIFSILFEGIIPIIDSTSTRDPVDILAYFAGGLVVYLVGYYTNLQVSSNTHN
ncbi:MAG: hypothetical protein HOD43_10685 [Candidatus Marinimicrobia bacterium]|nr:hypothetical protein [Candidatus Neomarinimicrobiota bacterium]MBT4296259.1 hypothetical protein [Candidatus Neomarinimicrobiota bacterium]MBT5466611.1 hypothetical protein [Candidatus Neomarinimicrobiota bacterium]MBT7200324.1 hypothetical protein [Candidatus Neomarinimicrobiota bacterium]